MTTRPLLLASQPRSHQKSMNGPSASGAPRGWIVNQALAAWVAEEEYRYQLTLEALADVDAGRTVDHDTVRAWATSLSQ